MFELKYFNTTIDGVVVFGWIADQGNKRIKTLMMPPTTEKPNGFLVCSEIDADEPNDEVNVVTSPKGDSTNFIVPLANIASQDDEDAFVARLILNELNAVTITDPAKAILVEILTD